MVTLLKKCFYHSTLSQYEKQIAHRMLNAEKVICKVKRSEWGMGRRIKIITEYRQTGGDADGDNMVAMGCGWVQNILPCHPLIGGRLVRFLSLAPCRHPCYATDYRGYNMGQWVKSNL